MVIPAVKLFACDDWHVKTVVCHTMIPRHAVLLEERIATGEGAQGDDSLPSFCAGLLSLRTGVGGRSAHGRIYIPGVAESASSESRIEGANLSQLSDIGLVLLGRYGPLGTNDRVRFGVYSRKLGDTRELGPPPFIEHHYNGFFGVNSIVARPEVATVMKRKLHRGS